MNLFVSSTGTLASLKLVAAVGTRAILSRSANQFVVLIVNSPGINATFVRVQFVGLPIICCMSVLIFVLEQTCL